LGEQQILQQREIAPRFTGWRDQELFDRLSKPEHPQVCKDLKLIGIYRPSALLPDIADRLSHELSESLFLLICSRATANNEASWTSFCNVIADTAREREASNPNESGTFKGVIFPFGIESHHPFTLLQCVHRKRRFTLTGRAYQRKVFTGCPGGTEPAQEHVERKPDDVGLTNAVILSCH